MDYFGDQFIKNKKSINQNSTINKNRFNYKLEDSNIDLSLNNSLITSLKFLISIFQVSPLSQMENITNIILSSFNSQTATKSLQAFLFKSSKENIAHIVNALTGSYRTIIKDKYGNYYVNWVII